MALKDIKTKISATKRMNTVTRAMEAVSAAKMRKTQHAAFADRPYARAAMSILARLSGSADISRHPLAGVREVKKVALVVITSDKGLAGGLNSGVIKAAAAEAAKYAKEDVLVYAYGKKGEDYFARREYTLLGVYENRRDDIPVSVMEELAGVLSAGFLEKKYDKVVAVYSNFKSTFEQAPTARTVLPLSIDTVTEIVKDIQPTKGKWSEAMTITSPSAYSVEPSDSGVLGVIIPRLTAVLLYHMLLEGKASEHSARMVAMKSASDKSKEVVRDLTRKYNKLRQAAITREVSEIVGGREALAT
jgi:F-type H+-transporting ATPase subunit gamma